MSFVGECGCEYVGEMCRPLQVYMNEHTVNVQRGNSSYSKTGELVWELQHKTLWMTPKLWAERKNGFEHRFKEAAFITLVITV